MAAEDILQDVFVRIHSRIDTLENRSKLESWLYRITRNAIIDFYRSRRPSPPLSGEIVLDLGSGADIDCFLAARATGEQGAVIGVDMTPEMIAKARLNAEKTGVRNVVFRLGEIENLPVADSSIDVIISNCVINLSPEKRRVYAEAFRVLRPGGRIAVSDIVLAAALPEELHNDLSLYTGCMAGASSVPDIEAYLIATGFADIRNSAKDESRAFIREWVPGSTIAEYVVSATIEVLKPGA